MISPSPSTNTHGESMTEHLLYFAPSDGKLSSEGVALCADALLENALGELPEAVRAHLDAHPAEAARVLELATLWSEMAQEAARAYDADQPQASPDPLQPLFRQPRMADTLTETPVVHLPFWRRNAAALAAAATILLIAVAGYWFVFRNIDTTTAPELANTNPTADQPQGLSSTPESAKANASSGTPPAAKHAAPSPSQIQQDEQEFGERFADPTLSQPAARTAPAPVAKPLAGLRLDSAHISPPSNANLLHPVQFLMPTLSDSKSIQQTPLKIEIRDNLNRLVFTSPVLESDRFTLSKSLPPGLYNWQLVVAEGSLQGQVVYQSRFRLYRSMERDGHNYNP